MLVLVTADNFIQLFVGWEGVGLCSYLLINFWFTRIQANKAAIKAMIVNRIGDFGLAFGILIIYSTFDSVEYSIVFALIPYYGSDIFMFLGKEFYLLDLVGGLLFIGAMGKSAQLGLHTWLPDAMEGPTPVSALIHAATMVTAGVFLIARCSPLFEFAPNALFVVTIIGAMTAFFAATTGLLQNDLKKVIAYSTCSQLGYMIFACGISNYSVAVFHLSNHAFFKALLFLGAGSVIHAVADEQDMRRMGGLIRLIPFTFTAMTIGSLALMGFPFLTGFYSKDVILEAAFASYSSCGHFSYFLGTLAAFFTAFYSMRLSFLTFLSPSNTFRTILIGAHDSPLRMGLPLFFLSFPSIVVGYLSRDFFIGLGTSFWNNAIFILPSHFILIDAEFASQFFRLLPLVFSFLGASCALLFYSSFSKKLYSIKTSGYGQKIYNFLNRKWFFDKVYNESLNQFLLNFSYCISYKFIDRGFIEMIGPFGFSKIILENSFAFSNAQTGSIYDYCCWIFSSILALLFLIDLLNYFFFLIDPVLLIIFSIGLFFC
jgi:NADH-ubiquinone oxidoreductase chain 5